jgi:hypothetical protein
MIEMLEGLPGSGKSYHSVSDYLLPWVRSNRRIYTYIDGFYLDRLATFEGRSLAELQAQITTWTRPEEVITELLKVEPGSAVLIDECQTIFRAQTKIPPELLRWLELHRHYGIDVVMVCQDFRQVTSGVTRLVEVTTKFMKLSRLGLGKRYRGKIRGNPEEVEEIRSFIGKYDAKVYSYYSSYRATVKEQPRNYSIFKSVAVVGSLSCVFVVIFGFFYLKDNPLSQSVPLANASDSSATPRSRNGLPGVPPLPGGQSQSETKVYRVEGSFYVEGKGWRYLLEGGKIVTASDLAVLTGTVILERPEKGVTYPEGVGISWGGKPFTTEELKAAVERRDTMQKLVGTVSYADLNSRSSHHSGEVIAEGTDPTYRGDQP